MSEDRPPYGARMRPLNCPACAKLLYYVTPASPDSDAWIGVSGSGPLEPQGGDATCPHCKVAIELVSISPTEKGAPQSAWKRKVVPEAPRNTVKTRCETCGKLIEADISKLPEGTLPFCSPRCRELYVPPLNILKTDQDGEIVGGV